MMYTLNPLSSFQISKPANTYIYDIIPVGAGLASISSDDVLRLLDPLNLEGPPVKEIKDANKDVTCLGSLNGENGEPVVVTAGRDGKVVVVDPRSGGVVGSVRSDQNAPILSLATSSPYGLAAGTELTHHQATISLWDTRKLGEPVLQYVESHSDDITELQFHPTRPQILLSGSTDGLVNIYDTTITDEEEALYQTINHGSSIHHADFLTDTDIFAVSHDERFSTYELVTNPDEVEEGSGAVHYGDLREKLGGEYVANVVRRPDGGAVLGIGMHSRESFELVQLTKNGSSWVFSPETKVTLPTAHGSEIVRSFCFVDQHQIVVTAGEDGAVRAWQGDVQ